jgi:hypothetical protein
MKILNRGLNREIDRLKFSYLVISKKPYNLDLQNGYLVISHLLKEKGKKKCFLCTPIGRVELVRLNKFKSKLNLDFDRIKRGDIILLKNHTQRNACYWQITKKTHTKNLLKQMN